MTQKSFMSYSCEIDVYTQGLAVMEKLPPDPAPWAILKDTEPSKETGSKEFEMDLS